MQVELLSSALQKVVKTIIMVNDKFESQVLIKKLFMLKNTLL